MNEREWWEDDHGHFEVEADRIERARDRVDPQTGFSTVLDEFAQDEPEDEELNELEE